ncbi:MAG: hypothetical protein ACK55Z_35865, partial [bacterium]
CIHSSGLNSVINLLNLAILSFTQFAAPIDLHLFILKLIFYFQVHFSVLAVSEGLNQAAYFSKSECL